MNIPGMRALRYSDGARTICEVYGKATTAAANATLKENKGYGMSSRPGARRPQGRWRVSVGALSTHAKRSNARHNTLIRIIGSKG